MCLYNVRPITDKKEKTGTGYKIFVKKSDKLFSEIFDTNVIRLIGRWIHNDIKIYKNELYPSGFHVFLTREGARAWIGSNWLQTSVIKKVKFRDAHTVGEQVGSRCVVARSIKILSDKV